MMRWIFALALALFTNAAIAADVVPALPPVAAQEGASSSSNDLVLKSLRDSPELLSHLAAVHFKGVEIYPKGAALPDYPGLKATVKDGRMLILEDFLQHIAASGMSDVFSPGDIRTDQVLFMLAHMTYYLENPLRSPKEFDSRDAWVEYRSAQDARAFIFAWNILADGAIRRNGGQPLNVQQGGSMLWDLHARAVFYRAMGLLKDGDTLPGSKLDFSDDHGIELTPGNIRAMQQAVLKSPVLGYL